MKGTYHMILLVSLVLFSRLFKALLTLAPDMMDDGNGDMVMESLREDFPSLDTSYSNYLKPDYAKYRNVHVFVAWNSVVV